MTNQQLSTKEFEIDVRRRLNKPDEDSISAFDIVPEEKQSRLIMLRERKRDIYFEIGDIANELHVLHQGTISKNKIYKSVAKFVDATERTVRYYAETAAFYPEEVREEFEVVPFTHFDLARNYGDDWRRILLWSQMNPTWSRDFLEEVANEVVRGFYVREKYSSEISGVRSCAEGENEDLVEEEAKEFFENNEVELPHVAQMQFGNLVVELAPDSGIATYTKMPKKPPHLGLLVGEIAELSEKAIQLLECYGDSIPVHNHQRLTDHLMGVQREVAAITRALDDNGAK